MNQFCQCSEDGWCPRFSRIQSGRFREICSGINCDLGTAAAFREQWSREKEMNFLKLDECKECRGSGVKGTGYGGFGYSSCLVCNGTGAIEYKKEIKHSPISILLKTDQCPGDAVVMTAAIYSLHKAYPGKYITAVESPYPEVFAHNPDVHEYNNFKTSEVSDDKLNEVFKPLQMHYPAIHQSNERGIHFMQGFCEHLGNVLGINVPLLTNRPRLYFRDNESIPQGDYWVVCSGGKKDLTNKLWGHQNYAKVINALQGINFVQVGADREEHQTLHTISDFVGRTSLRQLFDVVRASRGIVCGVSLLMHVAAALEKPCIVIAGGREPVQWNQYPYQHYLHTVGALPCTTFKGDKGACWRSRVLPLGDGTILDKDTCQRPITYQKEIYYPSGDLAGKSRFALPECMQMIKPAEVVELILRYNRQYD